VLNGNDMMLGFGSNVRTDIENLDSPTMIKALRQASKNIMFTIVRSGNYTVETENGGLDRMTTMFIGIDVGVGVVVAGIAAVLFLRYRKKISRHNFFLPFSVQSPGPFKARRLLNKEIIW